MMKGQSRYEQMHESYLKNLCEPNSLRQIGERPENINVIIKEPTYEKMGWTGRIECPDLFIGYYDRRWTVLELKHSDDKRGKAMNQIESGIKMLVDVFGVPLKDITGKFVIYTPTRYRYEVFRNGR
jgi:hypothetical protein